MYRSAAAYASSFSCILLSLLLRKWSYRPSGDEARGRARTRVVPMILLVRVIMLVLIDDDTGGGTKAVAVLAPTAAAANRAAERDGLILHLFMPVLMTDTLVKKNGPKSNDLLRSNLVDKVFVLPSSMQQRQAASKFRTGEPAEITFVQIKPPAFDRFGTNHDLPASNMQQPTQHSTQPPRGHRSVRLQKVIAGLLLVSAPPPAIRLSCGYIGRIGLLPARIFIATHLVPVPTRRPESE